MQLFLGSFCTLFGKVSRKAKSANHKPSIRYTRMASFTILVALRRGTWDLTLCSAQNLDLCLASQSAPAKEPALVSKNEAGSCDRHINQDINV